MRQPRPSPLGAYGGRGCANVHSCKEMRCDLEDESPSTVAGDFIGPQKRKLDPALEGIFRVKRHNVGVPE